MVRKRITATLMFGWLVCTGSVSAAPIVFTGYDIGSASLAASPLATAAAASFDAAAPSLSVIDFESGLPADVGLSGSIVGSAATLCATPERHCYATSGTEVAADNGAVFTFATPVDAFGAFFTGWQVPDQKLILTYSGGSTVELDMGGADGRGGTRFFGFIDAGAAITSIAYDSSGVDFVGLDDVRYGSVSSAPEPATLVLLGIALAGTAAARRRR